MKEIKDVKYVSTKGGDLGYSRNYSNQKLKKTDLLFDVLGTIDELSSILGVTYHQSDRYKDEIVRIQKALQHIMSLVATDPLSDNYNKLIPITSLDIERLETIEQRILDVKPIQPVFVLPGSDSTKESSYFDFSRAISRKAERITLLFKETTNRDDLQVVCQYLNRVSDLLFIMARSFDN